MPPQPITMTSKGRCVIMRVIVRERTRKGSSLPIHIQQPKRRWKPEEDVLDRIVVNEEVRSPITMTLLAHCEGVGHEAL